VYIEAQATGERVIGILEPVKEISEKVRLAMCIMMTYSILVAVNSAGSPSESSNTSLSTMARKPRARLYVLW
jgi:hypothetical protein